MADERAGRRAIIKGKCPGQGMVGCKIQWEVKNTENGVEEGRHSLEGSPENPCAAQGLVAIVEHPWGFGRIAHWWSRVQARI